MKAVDIDEAKCENDKTTYFFKILLAEFESSSYGLFTFDKIMCKAKKNEGLNETVM